MYYIAEFSDEQFVIINQKQLQEWIKDAQEFDGFQGWTLKDSFDTKKEAEETLKENYIF